MKGMPWKFRVRIINKTVWLNVKYNPTGSKRN